MITVLGDVRQRKIDLIGSLFEDLVEDGFTE